MSKKIFGGGKKAAPAATTEASGPKITALDAAGTAKAKRKRGGRQDMPSWALGAANPADFLLNRTRGIIGRGSSILSDKLGG